MDRERDSVVFVIQARSPKIKGVQISHNSLRERALQITSGPIPAGSPIVIAMRGLYEDELFVRLSEFMKAPFGSIRTEGFYALKIES